MQRLNAYPPVIAGVMSMALLLNFGCHLGADPDKRTVIPVNVSITVNNGAEATNDTLLRVVVTGDYISRMVITADSQLANAEWSEYDSLVLLPVPARDGIVSVFGRFASDGGGTTSVISDRIEIDQTAIINYLNVMAPSDTVNTGDLISFEIETSEPGYAAVTFGNYFSGLTLSEASYGVYSRTISIPAGINDDSVLSIASFRDHVGNYASPVVSNHSLVIRGRELRPHLVGSLRIPGMGGVTSLYRGGVCFVADLHSRIHLIDVLKPEFPSYMRSVETNGWCGGMAANDRLLYLADGDAGVAIIGIFPPNSAAVIGRAIVSDRSTDVELDGHNVYVSTYLSGLWVIDANDWIRPEVVSRLQFSGNGELIIRNENILFIEGMPSVACIDVTDSRYPVLLSEFTVEGDILDGIFYENRLYLATDTRGIVIYDVSDPANPIFHSAHNEFVHSTAIALMAPYIVIGRGSSITVVNGAVPELLPVVGTFGGMRGISGIDVSDNQMFIAGDGWFYTASLY